MVNIAFRKSCLDWILGEIAETDNVNDWYARLESGKLSDQFNAYCLSVFGEARELCIRKEKDYGSTWVTLGAKGLMVYMRAKMGRLWNLLWKGQVAEVKDEAIRDTLIDIINYCLFILYCLDTGNVLGKD